MGPQMPGLGRSRFRGKAAQGLAVTCFRRRQQGAALAAAVPTAAHGARRTVRFGEQVCLEERVPKAWDKCGGVSERTGLQHADPRTRRNAILRLKQAPLRA